MRGRPGLMGLRRWLRPHGLWCRTSTWLPDPDSSSRGRSQWRSLVPAPLSCALADAGKLTAASSLVARPGLRSASDRLSRRLQRLRVFTAALSRASAAPGSSLPTRDLVDSVHPPGQRSCATHADASVAGLVDLVLAIKAPLRSAFMAKPNPPSPWKGALSRPAEHNAGGLCALSKGHSPYGRRPLARVRLAPA